MLLRLAQRALKQSKFAFAAPTIGPEDRKGEEDDTVEGGDDGIEEELENKELGNEEVAEVEHARGEAKGEGEQDE